MRGGKKNISVIINYRKPTFLCVCFINFSVGHINLCRINFYRAMHFLKRTFWTKPPNFIGTW